MHCFFKRTREKACFTAFVYVVKQKCPRRKIICPCGFVGIIYIILHICRSVANIIEEELEYYTAATDSI
jgi:hypothetical protein